jgi:autotransporter-associated beta strand protein
MKAKLPSILGRPHHTYGALGLALGTMLPLNAQAATYAWNVASPGSNNWNINANWTPATGNPGVGDTAAFSDFGAGSDQFTANNVVSVNTTIASLLYTNLTSGTWNVTQVPSGTALTVTGAVTIGGQAGGGITSAAMTGGGTFIITGTSNLLTLGNTISTGNATPGTLDLSGMSTFIFQATNGFVGIGDTPTGANGSRSSGNLTLAPGSNSVTTATLDMNGATGTASTPTFNLGTGTNIINVGTFNVGGGRSTTKFQFSDVTGGLRLRGVGGTDTDRANMVVGNRNTGGTGTFNTSGSVLMQGHPVDMKFGTLTLGLMSRSQSGTDAGKYTPSGIFTYDQGTVDATTITMGVCSGLSTNAIATGTLTVGAGATLLVSNLSLANMSISPTNNSSGIGTLTVGGGIVNCTGSIFKTSLNNSTGTVTVTSGALNVAGSIGNPTNALDLLSVSDATLTFPAGITAPATVTEFDTGGSTNVINISSVPNLFGYPAQLRVVQYSGTIGGSGFDNNIGLGTLPVVSPPYTGFLSNNTANASIDLVITGGPAVTRSLTWGGSPSGDWDTITANWRLAGNPTTYNQNDVVLFDDTASGTTTVNLTTALKPLTMTVSNNTKAYTFSGSGSLSGSPGLVKQGAGTLTLANSGTNDFGGGITLSGGKLQIGGSDNRLPTNAVVTLANDPSAVLDLNSLNQRLGSLSGGGASGGNVTLGTGTLSIDGSGSFGGVISGSGVLVKSGTGTLTLLGASLYSGGTLINTGTVVVANGAGSGTGPGTVVMAGGTLQIGTNSTVGSIAPQASGYITNNGALIYNRSDTLTPAEIITGSGSVRQSGSGVLIFNHDNSYTNTTTIDRNNGVLRISTPNALGTLDAGATVTGGNGAPVSNGGQLEMSGGVVFAPKHLTLGCRGTSAISWVAPSPFVNHSGTNTWTGLVDITTGGSYIALQSDSGLMRIQGSIAGGPAATGTRIVVFRGVAAGEVSGVISNGPVTTLLTVCVGDSGTWTFSGTNLYTGSTIVTNTATLLVNGVIGGSGVDVVSGTLGGTGLITAPVTIEVAGTLAPGTPLGTLTISNSLTLNGTTVMEVSHTGSTVANAKVAGLSSVAFGGTLQILVAGNLTGGEVFHLFDSAAYAGDFATYNLPALSSPLYWSNSIATDGTLQVGGKLATPPQFGGIAISGTNLVIQGSGGTPNGTYYVLTSTNIALPVSIWLPTLTNTFDSSGNFQFSTPVGAPPGRRFYMLQLP